MVFRQDSHGFLVATLRDQPAGRLGEEKNEESYDAGESGLEGGGDSPGQRAVEVAVTSNARPARDCSSI